MIPTDVAVITSAAPATDTLNISATRHLNATQEQAAWTVLTSGGTCGTCGNPIGVTYTDDGARSVAFGITRTGTTLCLACADTHPASFDITAAALLVLTAPSVYLPMWKALTGSPTVEAAMIAARVYAAAPHTATANPF